MRNSAQCENEKFDIDCSREWTSKLQIKTTTNFIAKA
jgi:hypothetical protein